MDTKSNNYSISGMMGYCIWAYETGELHDAKKLLDSIFENYSKINTVDLMTGFAGVGWGIEYLAQRQFIEANTDEMLENIDDVLFRLRRQRKKLYELGDSLFEYGLYFLSRAKGGEANNCSTSISKKVVLAFFVDECERMFLTHRFDADSIPEVNIGYLNSTCYFLFEAFRLGVYPQKDVLVLKALMSYYTVYLTHNAPSVEEITTYYLMEYAKKTCFGFDSKIFDELQQNLTQRIVSLRYLKWTAASQLGWNMLLYREIFFDDRYLKLPILDTSVEMVTESESLGAKFYYLFAK